MESYDWPGNVSELKNLMQRIALQIQQIRLLNLLNRLLPSGATQHVD